MYLQSNCEPSSSSYNSNLKSSILHCSHKLRPACFSRSLIRHNFNRWESTLQDCLPQEEKSVCFFSATSDSVRWVFTTTSQECSPELFSISNAKNWFIDSGLFSYWQVLLFLVSLVCFPELVSPSSLVSSRGFGMFTLSQEPQVFSASHFATLSIFPL